MADLILSIGRPCVQKRLPGSREWKARVKEAKERHGAAGVPSEERRVSPIVELSLLLVSSLRSLCATALPAAGHALSSVSALRAPGMQAAAGVKHTAENQRLSSWKIAVQAECIQHGLRTIAFCHTRKLTELVTAYTRETLKATAPHLASSISVYRAGYSPEVSLLDMGDAARSSGLHENGRLSNDRQLSVVVWCAVLHESVGAFASQASCAAVPACGPRVC